MLKPKCCPNMPSRRIVRDVNEDARDIARALAKTEAFERSRRHRKSVEMLFAHLKRILRLGRLRLRGPCGAQDEFTLAPSRRTYAGSRSWSLDRHQRPMHVLRSRCHGSVPFDPASPLGKERMVRAVPRDRAGSLATIADFCNKIGTKRTNRDV
jgi:hypothetical protein